MDTKTFLRGKTFRDIQRRSSLCRCQDITWRLKMLTATCGYHQMTSIIKSINVYQFSAQVGHGKRRSKLLATSVTFVSCAKNPASFQNFRAWARLQSIDLERYRTELEVCSTK